MSKQQPIGVAIQLNISPQYDESGASSGGAIPIHDVVVERLHTPREGETKSKRGTMKSAPRLQFMHLCKVPYISMYTVYLFIFSTRTVTTTPQPQSHPSKFTVGIYKTHQLHNGLLTLHEELGFLCINLPMVNGTWIVQHRHSIY